MSRNAAAIKKCHECGSHDLSWSTSMTASNGVQQGRLNTSDVKCMFILGCNYCSETLAMVNADMIAERMNTEIANANPQPA